MDKSLPTISATPAANSQSKKRSAIVRPRPLPLALEARLMFDGAAVATTVETLAAEPTSDATQTSDIVVPEALPTQATRNEIVFVDTSVSNWSAMVASLGNTVEVVALDGTTDGLSQIANSLQGRSGLDAIHIISHGSAGNLQLSGVDYTAESIGRSYSRLQEIGQALAANGDILLYGCDIGQGSAGQALIDAIASITAADVAASSDATGAATAGGDWNLEAASGPVEASSLSFSDEVNPGLLGTPSVTSVDDRSYTEGQGAVIVDSDITVTGGGSYDGKYVRFSLTNGQTTDVLTLTNAANVNASGAISFSGTSVYLGNGSGRDIIGSIDATEDGTAGKALKINFVSSFTNASFESGSLTGWTAMDQVINLGTTSIAGFTSPNDGTYTALAGNDDAYPSSAGSYSSTISSSQYTDGSKSLQLLSSGITTASGYDVVHGPAVFSDAFSATAGDKIYFDWRAYAGDDAYDVYGYILNTATGATTTVLDATGASSSGSSSWATANVTIPTTGSYRFVFVSGTYDYSGGQAAGASLYIDNVRVYGSKVNDAVVTSIARQVAFNATSDNPVTSSTRVFTVTAMSSDGATGSDTGLITVSATNDAPVLGGAAQTISYTENGVAKAIDTAITVSDPDQPANFNGGWLQVQITGNGTAADQLTVLNQGTGAGQIGVSGSNVTFAGTIIGSIDAGNTGANNTALRINLNSSASPAAVQALARAIAFSNNSDTPSISARTVTFTLNDGGNTGSGGALQATRTATVNVSAVDDASVVTLGRTSGAYTENQSDFIIDNALTLADVDNPTLSSATVSITGNFRSAEDRLLPASGTVDGITYSYNTGTGVLTLSGSATLAAYQDALRSIKYENISENPNTATRTLSIVAGTSVAKTLTVSITRTNDAPVNNAPSAIPAIAEDAISNAGSLISSFLGATDADGNALGVAVTAVDNSNGTWQYSTDGGATWIAFGTPSDSAARLLRDSDKIRFVPHADFAGTATIAYRAWDRTTGTVGSTVDLSGANSYGTYKAVSNGDETAYSATKQTATLTVTAVNDAPVLAPASPALTGITEDDTTNAGQTVASLLGTSVSDVDASALEGIAITALTSGNGTWQYDTGTGWTNVGTVSASSALLLRATDSLRFVPDGKNATTGTVSFKAWDQTSGSAGSKVSTATSGGTSAFSTASDTASISVTAVNDAPVLGTPANLTGISEEAINNAGQTIASFLGSSLTDSDNGALKGIAITGASNGGATGAWQYSTDGGSTWHAVGAPDASTALLLKSTDLIRFNPDRYQGGTPTLTLCGWDQSSGIASSGATRGTADVSTNGGTTPFSSDVKTVSLSVSEVNDAPRFNTAASASSFTENSGTSAIVGAGLVLVDDGGNLSKATVSISAGFTAGDTLAVGTPGGLTVNYNSATGVLTLSGNASAATYQAALQSVTFTTASEDPTVNSATRTLTWKATDTSGLVSNASTSTLTITPLADAPVINNTPVTWTYTEDDGARIIAPTLTLADPDDTLLTRATVEITGGGGFTGDQLGIAGSALTAAGLTLDGGSTASKLILTGNASLATYQAVLRQVTFSSSSDNPANSGSNPSRTLTWTVEDAFASRLTDFPNTNDGAAGTSGSVTSTITIAPTNDAPVLSGLPGSAASYTEGGSAVTLASSITLADIDDANLTEAKVWISGGFTAGDTLSANAGSTGITVSYASATGILTLSHAGASKADFESVLRTVTFSSTSDDPTAVSPGRSISWQVTDADSSTGGANKLVSNLGTTQIDLTASDDGASISGLASAAFTENGSPVAIAPAATLADSDDTTLSGLTVTISSGLTSGDLLSVGANLTGTGITVTAFDSGTGQLVLSGTASLADYTKALNSIVFTSSSENPTATSGSRTFTWSTTSSFASRTSDADAGNDLASGTVTANAGSNTLTITARNDAPSLTLDYNTVLNGTAVVFQQGGLPIYVLDSSNPNTIGTATLSDIDDSNMASASVVISGNRATDDTDTLSVVTPAGWTRSGNTLTAPGGGTVANVAFTASTGTLTLTTASGSVSKAEYEVLLEHVQYQNSSLSPTASGASRELTWTVTDANAAGDGAGSVTGKSYMVIRDRNDAPTIAPTTDTVTYTEGDPTVALPDIVVTDVDPDEIVTATLTLSNVAAGALSVPSGASYNPATGVWTISGSVADVNTALAALTFAPATNNDQNATISISVADGGEDGATVASGTINLNVTAVNDAPVLTASHPVLAQLTEDASSNGGVQVSAFRGSISDVDSSFAPGIAITAQDAGNGKWQYQIGVNSGSWTDFGTISDASALVLADADYIRFVPNGENATTAGLNYRAWDGSGTVTAQRLDATATGGNTPFSTASDQVSLVVTDVNDAPILTAAGRTLTGITEDDIDNAGQTVSDLLGTVSDVDTGAVSGVAIYGQDDGNGTWQFRIDGTNTWINFETVSATSALLLSSTDHLRFVPNGLNATTANFSFRAWDQTSGTAGSKADASLTGGTTAFSTTSDTASLTVVDAVNDAPVLTPASPTLDTITEDENNNTGQTVASFLGSSISDVDNSALQGIAITDTTVGNGHWEYSIDANIWIAFPSISESTALLLRDTDRIRFVPDRMNGTTATLTYRAWDRTTVAGAGSRTDAGTNGGTTAFAALTDTATLTVTPVNDAPINDTLPTRIGAERANGTLRQIATAGSTAGVWRDVDIGDPATRITYQWQIADDASGNGLRDISGATASTYVISPDFVGKFLRLKVMGSDNDTTTNAYTGFTEITNTDPSATMALVDQKTTESVPITFTVPTAAFSDPDVSKGEDSFTYSAKLADGSPLPAWLTFDPLTLTFSGTPSGADVGVLAVSVFASDGGNFPASITFNLTVLSLPSNPQPASPLPPAELPPSNAAGIFLVPAPTIPSTTSGTVTEGGSGAASGSTGSPTLYAGTATSIDAGVGQPGGFNLGGGTGGFGLPGSGDSGAGGDNLPKGILTAPGEGAFRVVVTQSDQPSLMVYRGISDVAVQRNGSPVQLQIPADAFTHTNPMAVITLSARLSDGAPLPSWLKFDQASGKLVGTPPADFSGVIEVEVTARDDDGREARVIFKIKGASRIQLGHPGLSEQIRLASRPASSFDLGKATGLAQRLREPTRITT